MEMARLSRSNCVKKFSRCSKIPTLLLYLCWPLCLASIAHLLASDLVVPEAPGTQVLKQDRRLESKGALLDAASVIYLLSGFLMLPTIYCRTMRFLASIRRPNGLVVRYS